MEGLHRLTYDGVCRHGLFTVEILTWRGLITYYVLFFIQLKSRTVIFAGVTRHPTEEGMEQLARHLTHSESGTLGHQRFLLHDRDTKFCSGFRSILFDSGLQPPRLPARSPNLNAFPER
jgi:putative transposase